MTKRPRQFKPDYEIDGPHAEPLEVPWWVLPIVVVLLSFIAGALHARGVF